MQGNVEVFIRLLPRMLQKHLKSLQDIVAGMVSVSFTEDEIKLLASLVEKELKDFKHDEPMEADPLLLKGEAGYEQFLKDLAGKLKKR